MTTTHLARTPTRVRTRICAGLLVLATVAGLAACSSDTKTATTTTAVATVTTASSTGATGAGTSPEEHQADDTTVAAGLTKMLATAATVTASVAATGKVSDAGERLETDWLQVEGTVKTKEPETYLSIEDAITALDTAAKAGDATAAAKASGNLGTAIAGYLTKHP
ncbi:MAG: hypothetical protein JWM12_1896 [Ilumatobacteraceae bacterium]|nr:hypothetical protein [Ilumatobacteraceae bacterium]